MKYLSSRLILSVVSVATNFLSSCFYGCFTRERHGNHSGVEEEGTKTQLRNFYFYYSHFNFALFGNASEL